MSLNLKKNDVIFMVGLLVATLLTSVAGSTLGPMVEMYVDFMMLFLIIVALAVIYKARSLWGGEVARCLEIIGSGLLVYMISYVPHVRWHISESPDMLGIASGYWFGFFHGLSFAAFALVAYGFYLFWKAGQ